MSIVRLNHLMVTIPKGAEVQAREFYCGLLGLKEIPKPDSLAGRGGFWLEIGDQQIHIGVEDGVDRMATRAHVAYQVSDLAEWQTRLAAHGFTPLDNTPIPGYTRFEIRDPFGNRMEFIQPTTS